MTMRTLLVPLDGSQFAEHALPLALSIAKRAATDVELVRVYEPVTESDVGASNVFAANEAKFKEATEYLENLIPRIASWGVPLKHQVFRGRPADSLFGRAEYLQPSLVVMATHGRGPLSRAWLGSVADDLMRRLPTPLILVRPTSDDPNLMDEVPVRRILIPLDGSDVAEQVVGPAVALGKVMDSDFRLLRIVPREVLGFDDFVSSQAHKMRLPFSPEAEESASTYLRHVWTTKGSGADAAIRVVTEVNPASWILQDSSRFDVDLIAIATHGRGGIARLFLGSVVDKVVRGASVPVMVIRPH